MSQNNCHSIHGSIGDSIELKFVNGEMLVSCFLLTSRYSQIYRSLNKIMCMFSYFDMFIFFELIRNVAKGFDHGCTPSLDSFVVC